MNDGTDSSTGVPEPAEADLARLAQERDRLQAEVGDLRARLAGSAARRPGRLRRVAVALLVVMTSIVFTVAVAGTWARRSALNTDQWVNTVGPLAADPAVQEALGRWMTAELMGVIDPEAFFESVLPERGQVLAVPLTSALTGFVRDRVDTFLASDTFQRLWAQVNEHAHARAVAVLEGDPGNLQIEDGEVVLNLVPVLNQVLAQIGEASPEILGRTVDLPTVTVDDIPEDAVASIARALGRDVPDDFGQFTVFEAQRLRQVQDAVDVFNRLVVVAVALAIGLIALTLALSPHRRRTLLQLAVGIALGVVVLRRLGLRLEDDVVDLARPENQDAVRVVVSAFVSSLLDVTAWILAIAAVIAVVALLTGPYGWAQALRRGTVSLARSIAATVAAVATRRPGEPTVAWMAAHREQLQLGGIVAAIVVLLVADLSWLGLVLLALVIGGFELAVHRIGELAPSESQPEPSGAANVERAGRP